MSTALDIRLLPKVLEIIERMGKTVTFHVPSGEVYDPIARQTTSTITNINKKVSPPDKYGVKFIDGTQILAGDNYVILPASGLTFTPRSGHNVTVNGLKWGIVSVESIFSGEDICAYQIQLRNSANA